MVFRGDFGSSKTDPRRPETATGRPEFGCDKAADWLQEAERRPRTTPRRPKRHPRQPQMVPRWPQTPQISQGNPEMAPRWLKEARRRRQDCSREEKHDKNLLKSRFLTMLRGGDKMSPDAPMDPRLLQDVPKMAKEGPKMAPRWPQDGPT